MSLLNPSRTVLGRLIALTVVVWIVAAVIWFDPLAVLTGSDDDVATTTPRSQTQIRVDDITIDHAASGEIRYAEQRVVAAAGPGTLTTVAALGATVAPGTVLYEIDEQPVTALVGDVPAWRSMGVDDEGIDVAQLETNLVALGYDTDGILTVDGIYTSYTATLVEAWQTDLGREVTGRVELGAVVFVPPEATVTAVAAVVGDSAPVEVLTVSGTERVAEIDLAVSQLESIAVGDPVAVRLPDRSTRDGVVELVRSVGGGLWVADAALTGDPSDGPLPGGDLVPVDVSWVETVARDATVVRANALTRLDSGDYVVEVVDSGGSTTFVPVMVDSRAGSDVAIITDLPTGTVIIAP